MKRWKKMLSFALALAMIAGVTANHLHYLKAEAASLTPTGIKGDANGDGWLTVADLVRASVALSDGSRPCSTDAMFTNGTAIALEDIPLLRNRLLYNATGSVTVNVTGVDSNASVTVTRENDGVPVYSGTGSFSTVLPVGNYVVTAESDTAVAKTQTFRLDGDSPAAVDVETMTKLEAATYYKSDWSKDTQSFVFMKDTGIYHSEYDAATTGVLKNPGDVKNVEEWVLEADVQIESDWLWPSAGFALYNGSDFSQNVKFEIVRATLGDYATRSSVWRLRVNGKDYAPNAEGNSTEKWVAANQETLQGKVHLAVVHINGEYRMFINNKYLCAATDEQVGISLNSWGTVRPGFYAEQGATFENWSYSTDVTKYIRLESAPYTINGGTWKADTVDFIYEENTGIYRGTYGKFNTGMLEIPADVKDVNEWALEADVQILSNESWPSVGLALYDGTYPERNAKFEIVRDTTDKRWLLRIPGNKVYYPDAGTNSTEKWLAANQETLQGEVHLAVIHANGEYMMYINGTYLCGITGEEAANLTNGWGNVRLGFYAEQGATIQNWNYSTDVSKYARLESASYINQYGGPTVDFVYEENTGIYRGNNGFFNTGVLNIPGDVKSVKEWVLEADVEIISDERYPSVGFALYNGSNYGQNVKFEIVRATASPDDKDNHERLIRMNGVNYVRGDAGVGAEHSDWVAANQETLKGQVHLAVVHKDGKYGMFINGVYICAITGDAAANLTNSWGNVRLGFYAEQAATIANWKYSIDVSKYNIVD